MSQLEQSVNHFTQQDIEFMRRAIDLANQAEAQGEVPVGAVLVQNDKIIGEGFNCPISHHDPTAHAEIIALRAGAAAIQNYRILNSTLYVTLEPCLMCLGAIAQARITQVVFGAFDLKAGGVFSVHKTGNPHTQMWGGLLSQECSLLLKRFFQERRP